MSDQNSILIGRYVIRIVLRADNPAFPKYLIYHGGKFVGQQFSMPSESDCEWHRLHGGVYAEQSAPRIAAGSVERGKPRKRRAAEEPVPFLVASTAA